ncbi:MAG: glycosyl transferase family protein [Gammaproteobacteria bacterium]|nr:glycosyl transferase family protein [Gammaproteobacteria bacterium]
MTTEHPFAQFVRILGKGRTGSRDFTEQEAEEVMRMILANEITAEQLGAVLMLLRVKEETPAEIAGFVRAIKKSFELPSDRPAVDVDWSSYAGKRRHLPWYILSALLLAQNGITVFMHGASGHTAGRIYTRDVLALLGLPAARSFAEACDQLTKNHFSYMDLEHMSPRLHQIIELRPVLGLRSPVHTVARLINPMDATHVITAIHHPGYHPTHQESSRLLGHAHAAVVKGEGGEIERNPDMETLVKTLHGDTMEDELWPAMFKKRHVKPAELNPASLAAVWRGEYEDEYGEAAIIGTAAIVLKTMGRTATMEAAEALASEMWQLRPKETLAAVA